MKNQNGITLIALVITIIVLLILAGVAIAMLSGENGILTQATKASEDYDKGALEEAVKLAIGEIMTDDANLGVPDGGFTATVLTADKIQDQNDKLGTVTVTASEDGKSLTITNTKSTVSVDIATGKVTVVE